MKVVVLEDAVADIATARSFYDAQLEGLGDRFINAILSELDSLEVYAGIHEQHFDFFRKLVQRFPFAIYYKVDQTTAYVYAVLDMRRSPLWLREELKKR